MDYELDSLGNSALEIDSSIDGISDILSEYFEEDKNKSSETELKKYNSICSTLSLDVHDLALVTTYFLIHSQSEDVETADIDIDFICDSQNKCKALPVGNNYVVVFSEFLKTDILDILSFIMTYCIYSDLRSASSKAAYIKALGLMAIEILRFLKCSIKKLDDSQRCVFARMYELHKMGTKIFRISDIKCGTVYSSSNGNAVNTFLCDYQTTKCCFRGKKDSYYFCEIDESKVKGVIKKLSQNGIVKPLREDSDEEWVWVK